MSVSVDISGIAATSAVGDCAAAVPSPLTQSWLDSHDILTSGTSDYLVY